MTGFHDIEAMFYHAQAQSMNWVCASSFCWICLIKYCTSAISCHTWSFGIPRQSLSWQTTNLGSCIKDRGCPTAAWIIDVQIVMRAVELLFDFGLQDHQ